MPVRKGEAQWQGGLKKGEGRLKASGLFEAKYSASSRFEQGEGSNPEELIGAAHAGCFSMALAGLLEKNGNPPDSIETIANVSIDSVGEGFKITRILLQTAATVGGISDEDFLAIARTAKENCPVSQALKGAEISLEAKLLQPATH
jgi:osmotically inducible protein OsmC